jgi:hypothetical protein
MHREHGRHEDDVIFPVYDEFFAGVTREADGQHHELEAAMERWVGIHDRWDAVGVWCVFDWDSVWVRRGMVSAASCPCVHRRRNPAHA